MPNAVPAVFTCSVIGVPPVTVSAPVFNTVAVPRLGVTAVEPTAVPVASPGLVVLIVAKPVGTVVQVTRLVMSFSVPSL